MMLLSASACDSNRSASTEHEIQDRLTAMEGLIRKFPDSIRLIDQFLDTLANRGEVRKAADWCDTLLNRDPERFRSYLLLKADILRAGNLHQEAMAAYRRFIEQQPDDPVAFLSLANTMAEASDSFTLSFCDQVAQRFPNRETKTGICYIKGIYHNLRKEYAKARFWFDSTLVYDYAFDQAYLEKGYAWFDEGRFAQAAETFGKMTEIAPDNPEGWYWLGKASLSAGLKDKAIKAYERALLLRKEFPEARATLDSLWKLRK